MFIVNFIKGLFKRGFNISFTWRFGNGKKHIKTEHKKFNQTIRTYENTKAKKDSTIYKRR